MGRAEAWRVGRQRSAGCGDVATAALWAADRVVGWRSRKGSGTVCLACSAWLIAVSRILPLMALFLFLIIISSQYSSSSLSRRKAILQTDYVGIPQQVVSNRSSLPVLGRATVLLLSSRFPDLPVLGVEQLLETGNVGDKG